MVEAILRRGRVPVESRDPVHVRTPLGWAAFGSVRRKAEGENRELLSMIAMAEENPEVQATLWKHGARE
jgi:hypothetical protein